MHIPKSTADISCLLSNTYIGAAAREISTDIEFPLETATLMALSIATFSAGVGNAVCYEGGTDAIPIGLYALAEQPSGTGKTGVCTKLSRGLELGIERENEKRLPTVRQIMKSQAETKGELNDYEREEMERNHIIGKPVTNTTPEALDSKIAKQGGWFCLTSTEQGLLDTLIGGMYSEGKSNFDLMLKGFNAEFHNELRVTRTSYEGRPHGGVMCVSQEGSITTVLDNSGSTGLVERFLMLIEGDMRGHRTYERGRSDGKLVKLFNAKCAEIIENSFPNRRSLAFENANKIHISSAGWKLINNYRRDNERNLASGGRYNANIFNSMWSKFDIQVMKIAATLHLFNDQPHNKKIPKETVQIAMSIVIELFTGVVKICELKGIVGKSAEEADVESYFNKNCKGMGKQEREILDALRRRKVFKQYGNDARAKAKSAMDALLEKGIIQVVTTGTVTRYRAIA
jgi:hypothetical protein